MDKLLEVKNIQKAFLKNKATVNAVKGISFTVGVGECVGIVGESGCGKSTVARMIANLTSVDSGEIFLEGINIANAKGKRLKDAYKKMQMVFQMPMDSFNPRLTLGESIMESMVNNGFSRKQANKRMLELLKTCGLETDYGKRYPHEVSGGECQRAAISRAVAIHPRLIILDEATSALDVTVQAQILELLMKLKNEIGSSYIFICHDIALVQQICDRVIVMYQGEIVEEGTPQKVINEPQSAYTKMLMDCVL